MQNGIRYFYFKDHVRQNILARRQQIPPICLKKRKTNSKSLREAFGFTDRSIESRTFNLAQKRDTLASAAAAATR